MDNTPPLFEALVERAEDYGKTTYQLFKYKTIDKTAEITSEIAFRFMVYVALGVFLITLNTGIAFWLGELTGKIYFGFFIVASVYGLIAFLLYISMKKVKKNIGDTIVKHMLN